jgi:hypothetical protein
VVWKKEWSGRGGGGEDEGVTFVGDMMKIEDSGMTVMDGEGMLTSPLDEIGGRYENDVDSVGEYEGWVEGLWKKGCFSTKATSREIRCMQHKEGS